MARLAKDVLAEIPDQLILYMKSRGIKPNQTPPEYSPPGLSPTPTIWVYPADQQKTGHACYVPSNLDLVQSQYDWFSVRRLEERMVSILRFWI